MAVNLLECLFMLFLVYTGIYIIQWILGLGIALYRLADVIPNRIKIRERISDSVAEEYKVSVIISAYNEEDCILETIESLMDEDYPNLEILIMDDGSKDRMAEKIIEYYQLEKRSAKGVERYERTLHSHELILIKKKNSGKSSSLNMGLSLCTGKYCLILDADTKVQRGSIRAMVYRFLTNKDTIVCAGAVGNDDSIYSKLNVFQKFLLLNQSMEYYRTFYMQRIFLDRINANMVVSGAFALFDRELLQQMGGYEEDTIGEDMELTMRLHAFCQSHKRSYHIAYAPEAKCMTQFPFRYRDYFRQRRRWQIGMLQSLWSHKYMLINIHYGMVGIFSGAFFIFYELLAPFIELLGFVVLLCSFYYHIISVKYALLAMMLYYLLMLLMQITLVLGIDTYEIERIPFRKIASMFLIGCIEFFTFHIFNSFIKILAILFRQKHKKTWQHIHRA